MPETSSPSFVYLIRTNCRKVNYIQLRVYAYKENKYSRFPVIRTKWDKNLVRISQSHSQAPPGKALQSLFFPVFGSLTFVESQVID